jgi:hypothetical protein
MIDIHEHVDILEEHPVEFYGLPTSLKQFPPDLNPRDSQTVSDDGDSVH